MPHLDDIWYVGRARVESAHGDLDGSQRSSEVKWGKLCAMANIDPNCVKTKTNWGQFHWRHHRVRWTKFLEMKRTVSYGKHQFCSDSVMVENFKICSFGKVCKQNWTKVRDIEMGGRKSWESRYWKGGEGRGAEIRERKEKRRKIEGRWGRRGWRCLGQTNFWWDKERMEEGEKI